MPTPPSEEEVLSYPEKLSNWNRWGADDQLGTLNLITAERRRSAAALMREGLSVTCSWDILTTPQLGDFAGPPQRFMLQTGEGLADPDRVAPPHPFGLDMTRIGAAAEHIGMIFHGVNITHVDALCHIFWDRRAYNGKPAALVNSTFGATYHAITAWKAGIVGRGVLIDSPRVRGVPWLQPGEAVYPEDLEAAETKQRVRVGEGDILLLRTGNGRCKRESGPVSPHQGQAGWQAACLPWLHERGVAAIGCDTAQDVVPSGYSAISAPIHVVGIVAMGLCLIDNCDLEELAKTCERLGRWEFLFMLAPLAFTGATGSPANPLAIF
jgi:kynurenine formamidase